MSEYQRFITYINLYEKDEKRRNVGFAKIEKRKGQCRFEIHMKNIGYTGQNSQIYFYVRQGQELLCIEIGAVSITNGTADRRAFLNGDNIMGSGHGIEDIAGLVIFLNEDVMLASQWQDGEMRRDLFRLPQQEHGQPSASAEQPTMIERSGESMSAEHERQAQPDARAEQPTVAGNPVESAPEANPEQQAQPGAQPEQQAEGDEQPTPSAQGEASSGSLHVAEALAQAPAEQPWSATWQMMLESYPVLTPFEDQEESICIRIELRELRMLPRRYWYLGNNSFLLHGFFNYRYLILGQMQKGGLKRWFLGVPGVFQNQEKVMAAIFGFPEFKAEKITGQKTNQFGYWYRFMDE